MADTTTTPKATKKKKVDKKEEAGMVLLTYDIPDNSDFPNPSGELYHYARRINLSCWVMPTAYVPHNLLSRMEAAGINHHVVPFHPKAVEQIKVIAREALEKDTARIRTSLIKALNKATVTYEQALEALGELTDEADQMKATITREKKLREALALAGERLKAAIECAVVFDESESMEEALGELREFVAIQTSTYNSLVEARQLKFPNVSTSNGTGGGKGGKSGPRTTWQGHSLTAVTRWMGKEGWTFKEAGAVWGKLGIEVKDATIRCQLNDGKSGKEWYGKPADLTAGQEEALNALKEEV